MSLGHRTNLASKGKGDNSMCGKRGMAESVVGHGPARPARQGEGCIALSVRHITDSLDSPRRGGRYGRQDLRVTQLTGRRKPQGTIACWEHGDCSEDV